MNQLLAFSRLLEAKGWQKIKTDKEFIVFNKRFYNSQKISIRIPILLSARDISIQILLCLNKTSQIEKNIEQSLEYRSLYEFAINYNNKFNEIKNNWIIPEPESKYTENEIPSIYIP